MIPITPLLSAGISFVLILVLDVSGVVFGVAKMANLMHRDGKSVTGGQWAYIAASVGTCLAAITGCSPIIVHAESVAGVAAGARTGLCAVVIAFFFGLSMFLGPLFEAVPDIATAPCLVLVGVFMMKQVQLISWTDAETGLVDMLVAMPAFLCIVMMPFTYSIANGIFFGLGSYLVLYISSGALFRKLGILKETGGSEDEDALPKARELTLQRSTSLVALTSIDALRREELFLKGGRHNKSIKKHGNAFTCLTDFPNPNRITSQSLDHHNRHGDDDFSPLLHSESEFSESGTGNDPSRRRIARLRKRPDYHSIN